MKCGTALRWIWRPSRRSMCRSGRLRSQPGGQAFPAGLALAAPWGAVPRIHRPRRSRPALRQAWLRDGMWRAPRAGIPAGSSLHTPCGSFHAGHPIGQGTVRRWPIPSPYLPKDPGGSQPAALVCPPQPWPGLQAPPVSLPPQMPWRPQVLPVLRPPRFLPAAATLVARRPIGGSCPGTGAWTIDLESRSTSSAATW
jgi:hypothetical protein